jgi:Uncharacterized protein conserved in bacteria
VENNAFALRFAHLTWVAFGSMNGHRRTIVFATLAACAAAAVVLFLIVGRTGPPTDASPEAGFARDMATHHSQAVEMAFIVRDLSDDADIRTLSGDIIVTQSAQRGIFMGWLQQWGLDQGTTRPPMAWMAGHGGHGAAPAPSAAPAVSGTALMPGMATEDELARLKAAKGDAAEVLFLQLMIRHHEGGVLMAKGLLNLSDRPEVRSMAQHVVDTQSSEIALMTDMLEKRGARPYASILGGNA